MWALLIHIDGHIFLLEGLIILAVDDIALIGHQGGRSATVGVGVHGNLDVFEVRFDNASNYNVSGDFSVFVIVRNKL